ncbi:MAG: hypothetical protein AB1898_11630 [Acidobacteriota bacterium]
MVPHYLLDLAASQSFDGCTGGIRFAVIRPNGLAERPESDSWIHFGASRVLYRADDRSAHPVRTSSRFFVKPENLPAPKGASGTLLAKNSEKPANQFASQLQRKRLRIKEIGRINAALFTKPLGRIVGKS